MDVAHIIAKRATCFRLNVGAVITVANKIVSCGFNGAPAGMPHCSGNSCPGKHQCRETVHAEDNAFRHLPHEYHSTDKHIYITHSPCQHCAELIQDRMVTHVYFGIPYRMSDPLDWLVMERVKVFQLSPSGYIMDWATKDIVGMP